MALVLTNGTYYIRTNKKGGIAKTTLIEEAQQFSNVDKATQKLMHAPSKCKGYYVFNTDRDNIPSIKKRKNRKKYSNSVRKMIYEKADGHCALCGKKILFDDMTLDHINPLSMNGEDNISNLNCTCKSCNQFKGSILPDDFMKRITEIFLYQMQNKYYHNVKWKVAHRLLKKII